jgi:dipeptidyl-peptidase-2
VVFFYAGNEGDIENFWNNTGFMFDIAPIFQALVVFPEHVRSNPFPEFAANIFPKITKFSYFKRYYGKSLPFGDDSFDLENIPYLSVEQALADYAVFLTRLKEKYNLSDERNPIIAFGGSYGGILAAYMRFKYPNLVEGALAASAPIYLTSGLASSDLFFSDVTKVSYKSSNLSVLTSIRNSTFFWISDWMDD